ncbi:hypothetical protein [Thalassotalea atypica]|uniref:hypothetical protein n=1 Tax=Thalassotalea atypica TaxID=2054316 RepID=UPI00257468AF|nr:hypothetical protein [Thalassotalea atypica]
MNFEVLNQIPLLQQQLNKRIAYYSNSLLALEENKFEAVENDKKRIVIVAKTHYSERWQAFSAINKSELNKLLSLKKQSTELNNSIFQIIENKNIDGFDVKTIEFSPELMAKLGTANIYVPETELFHQGFDSILEIETPIGTLFSSATGNKVNSAYAKGIVANIETYRLSAGLPSDKSVNKISTDEFPQFLQSCLHKLPLKEFPKKALISPKEWINLEKLHWLYAAPLLTALVFYVLTNSYLAFNIYSQEASLGAEGDRVSNVLMQKQEIDTKRALLNQLSTELADQKIAHNNWDIVYQIVEEGATLTRITYKKGELTVRGKTDKASTLLAMIAEHQGVASASFKGSVRKSGNQESFVINIIPKESV